MHYESILVSFGHHSDETIHDHELRRALGEVAAGVVADPLRRGQIQVDVAVFAPDEPGRPRRVLSLGEARWDKIMDPGRLERLRRARDLLAVKEYDTEQTRLTCYNGGALRL